MLTIDQYSNYYLLSGKNSATANVESVALEATTPSQDVPTTAASPTQPVSATGEAKKTRDEFIKQMESYWQAPLTEEERLDLAAQNKTLKLEENLDIQAVRPDYKVAGNSDYVHNLALGYLRIVGMGDKQNEIDALTQGDPLDFRIQQEYEKVLKGLEMGDEQWSLEGLAYTEAKFPGMLAYAREAIFQRSTIEQGKGIDIGQLMHKHGMIDEEKLAALGPLSMPANSAKLQAYAAKVEAERAATDVEIPTESAERPAPENSIFLTVEEAQGFTSSDPKFKVYVVKSATDAYAKVDTSAVVGDMWVDARGIIQVPTGYLLEELLA